MDDYTCECINFTGCNVQFRWKSQFFVQLENKRWENIVMWDKGCCIPCAVAFAIHSDQEVMEGASHDDQVIKNYNDFK
jgi:hypothetical protein